jgi:3-oxoacyl-[acyl-carrier-protein] synthase III
MIRNTKITGIGRYLPKHKVSSEELDERLGLVKGTIEKKTGMKFRYYVNGESATEMGARASVDALTQAGIRKEDLECIVSCSGVPQQSIPCNASLIQEQLGLLDSGIPCFDINSTCMSFITGLDLMSHAVHNGQYKNALLVSTDISSVGIDYEHLESSALFGDGAVATVIQIDPKGKSRIVGSHMRTYSSGAHYNEIRGGGNKIHPRLHSEKTKKDFLFYMDGRAVFKLAYQKIDEFVEQAVTSTGKSFKDNMVSGIDLVIPHQASPSSVGLLQRKLGIPDAKIIDITREYGNMVAVSLPNALYEAITSERLKRGNRALLLGAGAGMSFGSILIDY